MAEEDGILDAVGQLIADARVEALKMGASPSEIGEIMMDEATLGYMVEGKKLSDIQKKFQRYMKKRLPTFYTGLRRAVGES